MLAVARQPAERAGVRSLRLVSQCTRPVQSTTLVYHKCKDLSRFCRMREGESMAEQLAENLAGIWQTALWAIGFAGVVYLLLCLMEKGNR